MPDFSMMFVWYFAFLFSTVVHEASHAWAAMKLGDFTAHDDGHVTLDPVPHIRREPFGMVIVPLVTYFLNSWMIGWASVPIDPRWALNNPRSSAWVSLAGPISNLFIAFVCGIAIRVGIVAGIFVAPDYLNFTNIVTSGHGGIFHALSILLSILFSLNILLFVFNLLPFPPLDGSGIVPLFLSSEESSVRYLHFINNPAMSMIGILIAWKVIGFVFYPMHNMFVNLLYWGVANY
jgi:Zn-dependent protease